jgi:hypothetical protein
MFYVRLGERQENTTGRTPSKPLLLLSKEEKTVQQNEPYKLNILKSERYIYKKKKKKKKKKKFQKLLKIPSKLHKWKKKNEIKHSNGDNSSYSTKNFTNKTDSNLDSSSDSVWGVVKKKLF